MASFNFEIKRQSYEMAVQKTGCALRSGNVEDGKHYLSCAIDLCAQLVDNCTIDRVCDGYITEYRKLVSLFDALERGENPFLAPSVDCATANVASKALRAAKQDGKTATNTALREETPEESYEFFSSEPPSVTLRDVAGLEEVKRQIQLNVIAPMNNPELYGRYMDTAGCRVLMYGPPGCGKSFVAEAIAGELGCFYAILNASDLLDKYVGEGAKKIARIFEEAACFENCLIFFDELESVFSSRESDDSKYSRDVLTTFLTCLSGFGSKKEKGVKVIIGATNRPWALDSALLRGKRFDTHIYVGLPDEEARRFLIEKAFNGREVLLAGSDVSIKALVHLYDGYSCADISAMLDKVKMRALERALACQARGEDDNVPVTMADVNAILSGYRNSITPESLLDFESFKNGEW